MNRRVLLLIFGILMLIALGVFQVIQERVLEDIHNVNKINAAAAGSAVASRGAGENGKGNCAPAQKPHEFNAAPYYEGPLFDAHVHMPVSSSIVSVVGKRLGFEDMPVFGGKFSPDALVCLLESEGITGAIGFFLSTKYNAGAEARTAASMEKKHPGFIAPFFMPGTSDALRVATSSVRALLKKNKPLFKGLGEIKSFDRSSLDSPVFLAHYALANELGLPVMMHPFYEHKAAVIRILSRFPNVRFLMHSGDNQEWIMDIIGAYPNAYYSLDADMVGLYGWGPEHKGKGPSKEEFLAHFRANFDTLLSRAVATWKPRIEAYPERFMWGTDRWYGWHFDPEVGALLEEFARAFIGRLSPDVQERFAYKNAEAFLRGR